MPSRNGVRDDKGGGHDNTKKKDPLPRVFKSRGNFA